MVGNKKTTEKKVKKVEVKKSVKVDGIESKNEEKSFDFAAVEKKWQKKWEEKKIFEVKEDPKKKKYYVLEMYPYPSASYLHMGHVRNYTIGDVYARFRRMNGFNVLYPMGFDSFGLPAETAAKKEGIHPKTFTENSIKKITEYFKALGNSYDWSKTLSSHEPAYYRWNQYFFLKMFEKGLAYRKEALVNWCENCQSVLANEEAESGKCWRCGNEVTKKNMAQWFLKITNYADRLLEGLKNIEWSDRIKTMQENWIGRSEGTEILFDVNGKKWSVFTTRPDTLFGVTFVVVAAGHPGLMELVTKDKKEVVEEFVKRCQKARSQEEIEKLDKDGVFTGSYAINPLTGEKVPVWTGNFVIADYGSGMVMAVPAHDERDFEFAKKYKIPVKLVIKPDNGKVLGSNDMVEAYVAGGVLINSEAFSGLNNDEAMVHITKALEEKKLGRKTVNYKIRDWMISRQRYWGTPIPMIHCDKCGVVAVPEKELPVLLPEKVDFKAVATNPLMTNSEFVNVKCPKCGGKAKRETDTMGGFMDSSWYFLRYCDNKNTKKAFEAEKVNYWMPVDQYIGGAEHAVMHLIYARFFIKFLKDLGLVKIDEPFQKLFNQGIVYRDGAKMSKSKGNAVFQTDISNKYGIDTARLFLMFVASPDKQMEWNDESVEGAYRVINKMIKLSEKLKDKVDGREESKINELVKKVTENIETFEYPKAIVPMFDTINYFGENGISKTSYEKLLKLISPFCPHISEELWEKIGNKGFISVSEWPKVDEGKINEKFEQEDKAMDKTVGDILNILKIVKEKEGKEPESVYLYVIPPELKLYNAETMSKKISKKVLVFAVNDSKKYDPEGKAGKAKMGKPGIFVE